MPINKIEITDKTILRTIFWVLLFVALFYFRSIVLVLFFSVLLASIVNRFASVLKRIKIPRVVSIVLFYLFSLGLIIFVGYSFLPAGVKYAGSILSSLPDLLNSFKAYSPVPSTWYGDFLSYLSNSVQAIDVNELSSQIKDWIFNTSVANSSSFIITLVHIFITVVVSFYISLSEEGVQNFLRLVTPKKYEEYIITLFERVDKKMSSWFLGQILVAFIVALTIYIVLLAFKIPFALPIAFLAGVFELLPLLGTMLAAVPALFFAWNMGGLSLAILILIAFFLISQLSSYFFYPKIVGKFINMPTVVIIIAIFAGAEIGGFWGALIAIPLTTIIMEILSDFNEYKKLDKNI
ncbi:hypothetical protein SDC9_21650 [bioreactor metagenome]|uniref:AI-2E family transporter n=1 Tax=bioreactor metagenome TaxID=1076179 RepID=A0A644UA19_9ZZZZ|nr:AI-2E family transporter [Candidatus Elulimicrobiales bacterium]